MSVVEMPVDLLGAVAKFACADESRANLNGVLIDKSEVVACDGHRLVRVDIGVGPFEGSLVEDHVAFLIPLKVVLAAVAAAKAARGKRVKIMCVDRLVRITVATGDGFDLFSIEARAGVVAYPAIDAIMTETRDVERPSIIFNPRYIEDIAPVMDACGVRGLQIVGWGDEMSPMQFSAAGVRIVVMPMGAA